MNLGPLEIGIIALVIIVLFGAKKIPELMGGLGKGLKEFKKAANDVEKDTARNDNDKKPAA